MLFDLVVRGLHCRIECNAHRVAYSRGIRACHRGSDITAHECGDLNPFAFPDKYAGTGTECERHLAIDTHRR